ncbi:MAG: retropepsin-like aspartic protease [Sphingomonadales bacterium]|jgi:predicted aspartyl protease
MFIDAAVQPPAVVAPAQPAMPQVAGFRPIRLRPSAIGHFHLSGTIAGKPVEVLIDTGASGTVIDRSWAESNGLTMKAMAGRGSGVGGAAMALGMLDEHQLVLDGMTVTANVVAMDLSNVTRQLAANNVTPPQIVVGVDVLRRHRAVIDYATSTLWLAPAPQP